MLKSFKTQKILNTVILLVTLIMLLFIVLGPYSWAFITSFKEDKQIRTSESIFWPDPFTIEHYKNVLLKTPFLTWYKNSILVATASAVLGIVVGAPAAYSLARFRFRGRSVMSVSVFITYVAPSTLLFIPFMILINRIGLINNLFGLLITYLTITVPFCTWILIGFFRSVPEELGENAMIDGCSRWGAFFRIELPLVQSGLIAVALFSFNLAWMEYIYALTLLTNDAQKTLPIGISTLQVGDVFPWGNLMAAAILTSLPIVILFVFMQRYFIAGLTAGAVKG